MQYGGTPRSHQGVCYDDSNLPGNLFHRDCDGPACIDDDADLRPGSDETGSPERREAVSLADAVVKALQNNLDIHIGRQTKESRLADIVIEQAKFDPTVSLNGNITDRSPRSIGRSGIHRREFAGHYEV